MNKNASTMASHLRDFIRMNPKMLSRYNENIDPELDEVYNILYTMGSSSNEKVEHVAYQLKDVTQTWYTQ